MENGATLIGSLFGRGVVEQDAAKVKALYVYPIKACRGVSVPFACVSTTGNTIAFIILRIFLAPLYEAIHLL
ncbi:hypothetical protein SUGI_0820280 [Cryptomeria japonica]|nr:hypothetical protein SUGI_0820280 [Cryptomeria japonica]